MFLPFSVWVILRFIKKKYLVCLGGYFLSPNWPVWLLLKISCVPSAFSIPASSANCCFHYRLLHHPPRPCSISSAHAGLESLSPGQHSNMQLRPSSFPVLSNWPGWREEGNGELGVERESQRSYPCAWNLILFICWSFSISVPRPSLSDWYWVTDGSEERIACFWECCNRFDPGKQTLG